MTTDQATDNGEWAECHLCNGTGIDDADFTGSCPMCQGTGERWVEPYHDDDEGDK